MLLGKRFHPIIHIQKSPLLIIISPEEMHLKSGFRHMAQWGKMDFDEVFYSLFLPCCIFKQRNGLAPYIGAKLSCTHTKKIG